VLALLADFCVSSHRFNLIQLQFSEIKHELAVIYSDLHNGKLDKI